MNLRLKKSREDDNQEDLGEPRRCCQRCGSKLAAHPCQRRCAARRQSQPLQLQCWRMQQCHHQCRHRHQHHQMLLHNHWCAHCFGAGPAGRRRSCTLCTSLGSRVQEAHVAPLKTSMHCCFDPRPASCPATLCCCAPELAATPQLLDSFSLLSVRECSARLLLLVCLCVCVCVCVCVCYVCLCVCVWCV